MKYIRSCGEAAFGGWLSGLLFAGVDLALVPGRIGIHTSRERLAAMVGMAFTLYPLAAALVGAVLGLLAARRMSDGREVKAEGTFLRLSSLWLALLGAAYLLFRVRPPTGVFWNAAITSGVLWLAAALLLAGRRALRWAIPSAGRLALGALWCGALGMLYFKARPGSVILPGAAKPERLVILITCL